MHDDLIDRLRRATADVPPSTLDLTAVLRSARRKRQRHRSAVATGCVAAVAGAGAVAPAVPGLFDGNAPDVSGVAAAAAACPSGALDVAWSTQAQEPVLRHADRVLVAADGATSSAEVVPFGGAVELQAPAALVEVREAILASAREQDRAGIYRDPEVVDEQTRTLLGAEPGEELGPLAPFEGFEKAEADDGRRTADVIDLDLEPGVHAVYDEGVQVVTRGLVTCGDDRWPVTLTYRAHERAGVLDCAEVVDDGFEWAVKDLACPDGVTPADDAAAGIDDGAARKALRRLVAR